MNLDDVVFDGYHYLVTDKWTDGHPYVFCTNSCGMGDGTYRLHLDMDREVYWCESCCSSFSITQPPSQWWRMKVTPSRVVDCEVLVPVRDRTSGRVVRVPVKG